ncbi:hypothetical protein ACOME3_003256 [Neoechinorhynchus agilis]
MLLFHRMDHISPVHQGLQSHIEIRGLIASKLAGAIIGRGGLNIKKLTSEYNTLIRIPDCDSPERILLVSGDRENCYRTIEAIFCLTGTDISGLNEFRMLIHHSQIGAIIGRKGTRIRDLRTRHGLDIKIFSECCPASTERIVRLRGRSENVLKGIREVYEIFDLQKAAPRGTIVNYDPQNQNEFMCPYYGGISIAGVPGESFPRTHRTLNNAMDVRHQMELMRRRASVMAIAVNTNHFLYQTPTYGEYIDEKSNNGQLYHDFRNSCSIEMPKFPEVVACSNQNTALKCTHLTIPNYFLPIIFGPNGLTLQNIKSISKTNIGVISSRNINSKVMPGSPIIAETDSIISIAGNDQSILKARHLLQQVVMESGLWRPT